MKSIYCKILQNRKTYKKVLCDNMAYRIYRDMYGRRPEMGGYFENEDDRHFPRGCRRYGARVGRMEEWSVYSVGPMNGAHLGMGSDVENTEGIRRIKWGFGSDKGVQSRAVTRGYGKIHHAERSMDTGMGVGAKRVKTEEDEGHNRIRKYFHSVHPEHEHGTRKLFRPRSRYSDNDDEMLATEAKFT